MKKEKRKGSKEIFVEGISSVGQRLILALGSTGFSEKSFSFYFVSTEGRLVDIQINKHHSEILNSNTEHSMYIHSICEII